MFYVCADVCLLLLRIVHTDGASGTNLVDKSCVPVCFYLVLLSLLCCDGSRVLLVGRAYYHVWGLVFPIGFRVCVEEGAVFIVRCVLRENKDNWSVGNNSLEAR